MIQDLINLIDFSKIIENENEKPLYARLIGEIINYLKNNNSAEFNEIIKNIGGSDRRMIRLLNQMVEKDILVFNENRFSLKNQNEYSILSKDILCKFCNGQIVGSNDKFDEIKEIIKKVYEEKPKPTFVFDQRPVNFETTVRRAAYLLWRGDIQNKKIAILGDDDLTSIAIGLMGVAKEITVFEIDKRLVEFIKKKSDEFNLNIKIVEQDLTNEVPDEFAENFDLFLTDPTPTKIPFSVFLNVAIKLVKKDLGRGYLSFLPSCMDKSIDIQKIITERGLLITDMIPFFTQYDFVKETYSDNDFKLLEKYSKGKSDISFFENLVRVETTNETKDISIKYSKEDLFGRATKRVLANPKKDPAIRANDAYVKEVLKNQTTGEMKNE